MIVNEWAVVLWQQLLAKQNEQESVGQGWEQAESVGQGWQQAAMHVQVINGLSTYIWHYRVETRW